MYFLGYHGTSETSAQNILSTGIRIACLPKTGQIGPGFYVAKMNGLLPEWGATQATALARDKLPSWVKIISYLTGGNRFFPTDAKMTILKIFSRIPILHCKWNPMNPCDFHVLNVLLNESENGRRASLNDFLFQRTQWLQMVIPPKQIMHLFAIRDNYDGDIASFNWNSKSKISPTASQEESRSKTN